MLSLYGDLFDHPLSLNRRRSPQLFTLRPISRQAPSREAESLLRSALHDFDQLENELFRGFPAADTNGLLNRHSFSEACLQPLQSEDSKSWGFSLGTSDYSPGNLKVELDDRCLSIKGSQQTESEDGKQKEFRSFQRMFTIPEDVKMDSMKVKMDDQGRMIVHGEKEIKEEKRSIREIPIEIAKKSSVEGAKEANDEWDRILLLKLELANSKIV